MSVDERVKMPPYGFEELPRPVVAFLLGGCKLRPREALVACLRELADEGLVRYETDAAGMPVISLDAESPRSGRPLQPFEQVALARVRTRAGVLARVPFSALISDDGDDYKNWARQQADELGQEAQQAGLAVKAPPVGIWRLIVSLIAVAIVALVVVHGIDWKAADDMAGPVLSVAFLALFVPHFLRRWRLTSAGVTAVASWRRDGYGVPGAAQGLHPDSGRTVWALDGTGAQPLPRGQAWSSLGGQWHTVQLGQELSRPSWSTRSGLGAVLVLTFMGSFFSVLIGFAAFSFDPEGQLIAITPAALAAVVIVLLWLPAFTSRMRLPDTTTFSGEVVKLQYVDGGSDSPDHYFAWIDDGSPTSMKFDVTPVMYRRLSTAALVRVSWSPRRGCLDDITPA